MSPQRRNAWLLFLTSALGLLILSLFLIGMVWAKSGPQEAGTAQGELTVQMLASEWAHAGDVLTYTIIVSNTTGHEIAPLYISDTWSVNLPQNLWNRDILPHFITYSIQSPSAVTFFTHVHDVENKRGEAYWHLDTLPNNMQAKIILSVTVPITLEPALGEYEGGRVGPSSIENSLLVNDNSGAIETKHSATMIRAPLVRSEIIAIQREAAEAYRDLVRVGRLLTVSWKLSNLDMEGSIPRPDTEDASYLRFYVQIPPLLAHSVIEANAEAADVITQVDAGSGWITWTFPNDYVLPIGESTLVTMVARLPADTTYNPKQRMLFDRAHMLLETRGRSAPEWSPKSLSLYSWGPFEKSVTTQNPPSRRDHTYSNHVITYTLNFYNPLQTTINGAVLTDTLPVGFHFLSQVDNMLPAPTANGRILRWDNVTIPANGIITATFRVSVSTQTPPDRCSDYDPYVNAMTITHHAFPNAYIGNDWNRTARIYVDPQLYVKLYVAPSKQYAGEVVTYTILVGNDDIAPLDPPFVLTITLPVSVTYLNMVSDAPPGEPTVISDHILVWDDLPALPARGNIPISFRAIADGEINRSYEIYGELASPRTILCPSQVHGASFRIISPFEVKKIALSNEVVMGEHVGYQATIYNHSPRNTYVITAFEDLMPSYLVDASDGDTVYTLTDGMPVSLGPNSSWTTPIFTATYVGGGLGTTACSRRPGSIAQERDHVRFYVENEGIIFNGGNLASFRTKPQVELSQDIWPNPAAYSHTQILTITLHDNRTEVLTDITGLLVHWEAPTSEGVTYQLVASNPPTTSQSGNDYYWDVTLPGGQEATIVLTLTAPMPPDKAGKFASEVEVVATDDSSICVPSNKTYLYVARGLRVLKEALDTQVGPYNLVRYDVRVTNETEEVIHNVVLTDILPTAWTFEYADPNYLQPVSIDPPVWVIETIRPKEKYHLRFAARTYNYLGIWYNDMEMQAPVDIYKDHAFTSSVAVQVISGIGMYKVVAPPEVMEGESAVYTITVYNGSSDRLINFTITDTLPTGIHYTGMTEGDPPTWITPTAEGDILVWKLNNRLDSQRELNLGFRVSIDNGIYSGYYYNSVTGQAINYDTGDVIILPAAERTAPLRVHGIPSGEIEKTVYPDEVMAGQIVTYTISLHSMADLSYTVRLTDTLPPSLAFESAVSSPAPTVIEGADGRQRIVWTTDDKVAPNETRDFIFRARVNRLAGGTSGETYCNDITFQMGKYTQPAQTELACLDVTPLPRIDGEISVDDHDFFIAAGKRLTYTIRYTNAANSGLSLYDLQITSELTPLDYITPQPGAEWTSLGNGRYRYTATGPLAPGASGLVTFAVQADEDVPEEWNRAFVHNVAFTYTTHADHLEFDLFNNYAADMDSWQGRSPDLIVESISFQPDIPRPGEPMTLTARIRNTGHGEARKRWDDSTDETYLFVLEFYLREHPSTPPSNVFDHQGGWSRSYDYLAWSGPLRTGETRIITAHVPAPAIEGSYDFYAQVDISDDCTECGYWGKPWGLIAEEDETNNIYTYQAGVVEVRGTRYIYLPLVLKNH